MGMKPLFLLGKKIGAEGQSRTADTTIFSRVLYQLSYLGTPGTHGCGRDCRRATASDTIPHAAGPVQPVGELAQNGLWAHLGPGAGGWMAKARVGRAPAGGWGVTGSAAR